jgi:hypothetical protein
MPWFLLSFTDALAAPDPEALARDAFVWGYPLVVSTRTMANFGAPNELRWSEGLADETSRAIVQPNNDTLYVTAALDLRAEPMVLEVTAPAGDRYFSFQFLDAWTEAFDYVGTRATNGRSGTWVVTPPGWQGTLPEGAARIRSDTPQIVVLGRYAVTDDADVRRVLADRDDVRLVPLSEFTGERSPTPPPAAPASNGAPSAVGLRPLEFWDELGDSLAINPPRTRADEEFLTSLSSLGVGPGLHPSDTADAELRRALIAGAEAGLERVRKGSNGVEHNGWDVALNLGKYGQDHELRAFVAWSGWGANVADEAVYPSARADAAGNKLDGSKTKYHLVFPKGKLPPARAFWSVTVYGNDGYLVANDLDRFSIGSRTEGLKYDKDGSLDLVLSAEPPKDTRNWLPIPDGPFKLTMRVYLPGKSVLDGTWSPPPLEPAASAKKERPKRLAQDRPTLRERREARR